MMCIWKKYHKYLNTVRSLSCDAFLQLRFNILASSFNIPLWFINSLDSCGRNPRVKTILAFSYSMEMNMDMQIRLCHDGWMFYPIYLHLVLTILAHLEKVCIHNECILRGRCTLSSNDILFDMPTHRKAWNYFTWYHVHHFLYDQFDCTDVL